MNQNIKSSYQVFKPRFRIVSIIRSAYIFIALLTLIFLIFLPVFDILLTKISFFEYFKLEIESMISSEFEPEFIFLFFFLVPFVIYIISAIIKYIVEFIQNILMAVDINNYHSLTKYNSIKREAINSEIKKILTGAGWIPDIFTPLVFLIIPIVLEKIMYSLVDSGTSITIFDMFTTPDCWTAGMFFVIIFLIGSIVLDIIYKYKYNVLVSEILTEALNNIHEVDTEENNDEVKENSQTQELIRLKELLDSGIITQEDFEAKKKQILGI